MHVGADGAGEYGLIAMQHLGAYRRRGIGMHGTVLYHAAGLACHGDSLRYHGRYGGSVEHHVCTTALGKALYVLNRILLHGVESNVGSQLPGQSAAALVYLAHYDPCTPALRQHYVILTHYAAAYYYHVFTQLNVSLGDAMHHTCKRLGQAGFFIAQSVGYLKEITGIYYNVIAKAAGSYKQSLAYGLFLRPFAEISMSGTAVIALAAVVKQTYGNAVSWRPHFLVHAIAQSNYLA